MPRRTAWKDEFTLLCEECGYVVEGLSQWEPCPECGQSVEMSVPSRRVGTPWQRAPCWRNFWKTMWGTCRRPRETFDELKIDEAKGRKYAYVALTVSGGLAILPFPIWATSYSGKYPLFLAMIIAIFFGAVGGLCWVILVSMLVIMQRLCMRVFARAYQWRVPQSVATSVCSLASIGWIATPAIALISTIVCRVWRELPWIAISPGQAGLWTLILWGVSIFVGFLAFEILVWIGFHQCRFANRERKLTVYTIR